MRTSAMVKFSALGVLLTLLVCLGMSCASEATPTPSLIPEAESPEPLGKGQLRAIAPLDQSMPCRSHGPKPWPNRDARTAAPVAKSRYEGHEPGQEFRRLQPSLRLTPAKIQVVISSSPGTLRTKESMRRQDRVKS